MQTSCDQGSHGAGAASLKRHSRPLTHRCLSNGIKKVVEVSGRPSSGPGLGARRSTLIFPPTLDVIRNWSNGHFCLLRSRVFCRLRSRVLRCVKLRVRGEL